MKILIISPTPTHPATAGNRARIQTFVQGLMGAGHVVHFAFVPMEPGDAGEMRGFFNGGLTELNYRETAARGGAWPKLRRRLLRAAGSEAAYVWGVDDWYDRGLDAQLRALHARERFDAVFAEYVFLSRALDLFPASVLKLVDTHDRFGDRHLSYLRAGKRPEWFSTTVAEELRGLRRADVVLAIQDQEARDFAALLGEEPRVVTVGHLLDMSARFEPSGAVGAVFVASGNSINVDAASYFITEVLPAVRKEMPEFELVLAGDVCRDAPDAEGVRKLGRVARVSDAYAEGQLAVNTVRMGTGLNIKTMECLALGVPLVATESGSRGLEDLRDRALACVPNDDPAATASTVLGLLRDPVRAKALAEAGRAAAEAWNARQLASLADALRGRVLEAAGRATAALQG